MCSLCGVLGGASHWTEDLPPTDAPPAARPGSPRLRARQELTRLLNRVLKPYGLTVDDWAGSAYLLRTRTGNSVLVDNLSQLWAQAEAMQRRACDPLDAGLLAELKRPEPIP